MPTQRYVPYSAISGSVFKAYNQLCVLQSTIEKEAIDFSRLDPRDFKDTELFIPVSKLKWYLLKDGAFCFLVQALSEAIAKDQFTCQSPRVPDDPTVLEEKTAPAETPKPKNPSTKKTQRRKKKAK